MNDAVITGTFSDLKLVKTRSAVQLVIEVPIEAGKHVTDVLGFPLPGAEVPVAIARLAKTISPKPVSHKLAQEAGILCNEGSFRRFIWENCRPDLDLLPSGDETAAIIRDLCGVGSRSDLDTNEAAGAAWRKLKAEYEGWKQI